jgi:hypothetical protein
MTATPRRNHTVTAGYLGRFARNGRIAVHRTDGNTHDYPHEIERKMSTPGQLIELPEA